ncbi:unnamed protein product [Anisakis simplex]|uniref:Uncharacterized protein n=1 Tax=Anisakis simplex TaxID=6269 RepID=A0A0M3JQ10_ANISI|nr:unnamed protein product [Anisakis simplex]
MVYLLRVLVCSDKIAVRKAFEGKLHAIAGTMKPSAFEAIDNELTDAHILFEVFWQSVAVLHEVSRKLLSSEGV